MILLAFLFHFLSFYEHPEKPHTQRETMSPYATTEKLLMRGTYACQSMDTQGKGLYLCGRQKVCVLLASPMLLHRGKACRFSA